MTEAFVKRFASLVFVTVFALSVDFINVNVREVRAADVCREILKDKISAVVDTDATPTLSLAWGAAGKEVRTDALPSNLRFAEEEAALDYAVGGMRSTDKMYRQMMAKMSESERAFQEQFQTDNAFLRWLGFQERVEDRALMHSSGRVGEIKFGKDGYVYFPLKEKLANEVGMYRVGFKVYVSPQIEQLPAVLDRVLREAPQFGATGSKIFHGREGIWRPDSIVVYFDTAEEAGAFGEFFGREVSGSVQPRREGVPFSYRPGNGLISYGVDSPGQSQTAYAAEVLAGLSSQKKWLTKDDLKRELSKQFGGSPYMAIDPRVRQRFDRGRQNPEAYHREEPAKVIPVHDAAPLKAWRSDTPDAFRILQVKLTNGKVVSGRFIDKKHRNGVFGFFNGEVLVLRDGGKVRRINSDDVDWHSAETRYVLEPIEVEPGTAAKQVSDASAAADRKETSVEPRSNGTRKTASATVGTVNEAVVVPPTAEDAELILDWVKHEENWQERSRGLFEEGKVTVGNHVYSYNIHEPNGRGHMTDVYFTTDGKKVIKRYPAVDGVNYYREKRLIEMYKRKGLPVADIVEFDDSALTIVKEFIAGVKPDLTMGSIDTYGRVIWVKGPSPAFRALVNEEYRRIVNEVRAFHASDDYRTMIFSDVQLAGKIRDPFYIDATRTEENFRFIPREDGTLRIVILDP